VQLRNFKKNQEDANLTKLYRVAIRDSTTGPERLQRNIWRLFKLFARDLRREASEELEIMTSSFVSMKERYIAQCIIEESTCRVRIAPGGQL
jgi:hypothetical protein